MTHKKPDKKDNGSRPRSKNPKTPVAASANSAYFPIIGVGASAGGLEAFTEFLHALPEKSGMAFVFVQHLDPKHVSMLTEILVGGTVEWKTDLGKGTEVIVIVPFPDAAGRI